MRGFAKELTAVKPRWALWMEAVLLALCQSFAVFSFVRFWLLRVWLDVLLSLGTILLLLLPLLLEGVFHCAMSPVMVAFSLLYALCPLLGHGYKLYYVTDWWDKLMHCSGGVAFAILGLYLPYLLNRGKEMSVAMRAVFAFCFSIALSALWEFYEFGSDRLLGTDMQVDTYVTAIHSYFLGDGPGVVGSITDIESVVVDGVELDGYLDIGLFDTMWDMLIESLGALIVTVLFLIDRGRHPAFQSLRSGAKRDEEEWEAVMS